MLCGGTVEGYGWIGEGGAVSQHPSLDLPMGHLIHRCLR